MEPRLRHAVQIMTRCHEHHNGRICVLDQKQTGDVWLEVFVWAKAFCTHGIVVQQWANSAKVNLLSTSSRCLNPAVYWKGTFVSCGEGSCTNNIYTLKQNLFTPPSAIPSPIVLHNVSVHLTLNKLFRKASCHLKRVYTKQHGIIHCFNV